MYIRTFRASSLQDALEQIRVQMGPDASVLHTRQVREGWLGWLGRTYVEVTAGSKNELTDATQTATVHLSRTRIDSDGNVDSLSASTDGQQTSTYPLASSRLSGPLNLYRDELLRLGVRPNIADRWVASASSFAAATTAGSTGFSGETLWMDHLRQSVARDLRIGSPIRTQPGDRRVVALVGPTGVGKTTTVAKLAAGFRLQARRRVGLLTIDTFRIAAVQQLRAYADIMDLPMEVVERESEMPAALDRLGDVDLVLIDTAGRSPRSDARIEQLVGMLRPAQPDETLLVLSSTASRDALETTIDGFAAISPTSAILTKLDETPHLAGSLSALVDGGEGRGGLPLAYVTNGQQVPDDIAVADCDSLLRRLIPHDEMGPPDATTMGDLSRLGLAPVQSPAA